MFLFFNVCVDICFPQNGDPVLIEWRFINFFIMVGYNPSEALTESCGWRWFPNTETYIDVWVFDYGSMEFIENPDLSSIPKGLQPGDPPVKQPGRES